MRQRSEHFLRKGVVLGLVAGIAVSGFWLIAASFCLYQECIEDDASRRAHDLIGMPMLVGYLVLTLALVFLPALALRRTLPIALATLIPAVAIAGALFLLFFDRQYDSWLDAIWLTFLLAAPWILANLVGLMLWPSQNVGTVGTDIDAFD